MTVRPDQGTDAPVPDASAATPPDAGARAMTSQRDLDVLRSFARRIDPTDAGAHNNLGVLYYNKGLYEESVAALMRALELDPRMKVAQGNLELAYLDSGHALARVTQLREQMRKTPRDREARWELGRTYALLGQHLNAIGEFSELLRFHPGDVPTLIQLALAQKADGDVDRAQQSLDQALAEDPGNSLVHIYMGEIAYNRGLHEDALAHLHRAIELQPQNHEALYLMGFVLDELGRPDEARDATKRAQLLNPAVTKAQSNLTLTQPREPYVEKAARDAERGGQMEIAPDAHLTHYNQGHAFRKKAYYTEALREYQLAIQKGEDRDLVEQAMAEVYLLRRDAASALRLYDGLLARKPDSPKLWNERGVAQHQAGRYLDAQESYERAIAADPAYALSLNNLGVALYHAGNPAAAGEAFQRAITAQPAFVKGRLNLALQLTKGKRLPAALETFRQVLAVEAEHPVAWNGVGLVLAEFKKFPEARNAFARAIQSRPRYAEAHYNLSFTLSNLADFEGALRETKLAIELDPYYVAQKFELAIDLEYEDPDLSIQPDLGQEKRVDEAVEDFTFDPGVMDSLFSTLAPAPTESLPLAGGDPFASAAELLSKGFFERAQAEATRALARGGDRVRGGALLGDIFSRRGLWGEALERYRDVRRVAPEHPGALLGEGTALLRLGRAIEARHVAETLLPLAPSDVETLLLVAATRGESGDAQGAMAVLESARRMSPTRADVLRHLGDMAWKLRDANAAIDAYRGALQIDPLYAVVRFQLANLLIEQNLLFDAERELLQALDAVPTYAEATLGLSRLLRRVGRPNDAMPLLIGLLQRDPYHFEALLALGETLLERGKKDDANVAFLRVLRFDPTHVGALYYEGSLLVEHERYREAVERFQKVIDTAPSSEYARRARRDIKSATDLGRRQSRQVG
jgi:superkiller protein 3